MHDGKQEHTIGKITYKGNFTLEKSEINVFTCVPFNRANLTSNFTVS